MKFTLYIYRDREGEVAKPESFYNFIQFITVRKIKL